MKQLSFIFLWCVAVGTHAQTGLSGTVKQKGNGEPLPGAGLYFPDLRTGVVSQSDGSYKINKLPKTTTLLQVKLLGYKTYIQTINLDSTSRLDIELEESVIEANEVVVTGVSKATEIRKNPLPMTFVDRHYLDENSGTNAIEVLNKVPGFNSLSTGPNVSKPVIRGLGYSRVLTLFDGVRQEGQQWGDEHGVEVDQYLIDRVEVVKGPASLMYGSDGLAGVVNLLPANSPPQGIIRGGVEGNFQSNNRLRSASVMVEASTGHFVWGFRMSRKVATDYTNSNDGLVYNTGFDELDPSVRLGLNGKWGYSHLTYVGYLNRQEIPDGSRDSASRMFTKQVNETDTFRPIVTDDELNSIEVGPLHQQVTHHKIYSNTNLLLGRGKLDLTLGFQKNERKEFSHPQYTTLPGLSLNLQTGTYDIKYHFPTYKSWEIAAGLNGMYQQNRSGNGTDFIIPDFNLFDLGPFLYARGTVGKWDLAMGVRYDTRTFVSDALYVTTDATTGFDKATADTNGTRLFDAQHRSFSGFSGSLGLTRQVNSKLLFKANIARGYRAPNITEVTANGVHPGTGYSQAGDENLVPEYSLQEDLGLFFESEHVSASAEVFYNLIDNYIFNQKMTSLLGGDSIHKEAGNDYPVYKFRQCAAQLYGGEFRIDIHPHPLDWLHFENSLSMVYAHNLGGNGVVVDANNKYLPFIPPLHTNSELHAELGKKGMFSNIFIRVGFQYYASQDRVHSANETETRTPGYGLIDAGAGCHFISRKKKTLFTVGIYGTNLGDVAFQSHLSRLKYMDNYPNNATGRSGIYGMGRNISVKVAVPFE